MAALMTLERLRGRGRLRGHVSAVVIDDDSRSVETDDMVVAGDAVKGAGMQRAWPPLSFTVSEQPLAGGPVPGHGTDEMRRCRDHPT